MPVQPAIDIRPEPTESILEIRHNWRIDEVENLFALPFNDLVFRAQTVHRRYFDPNEVQISTLLSIKTGACSEDCAYCPQSARYDTGLEIESLMPMQRSPNLICIAVQRSCFSRPDCSPSIFRS